MKGLGSPLAVGSASALGAFAIWGLFPLYFREMAAVPAVEILSHRILWTAVVTALLIVVRGHLAAVIQAARRRRLALLLAASATVISLNWGVFIWAVTNGFVLQSSLGYYVNPLVSVALGVVILGERLRPRQWAAVALAGIAVLYRVVAVGSVPWIALTLAVSFGLYGLIRKVAEVDPVDGLFLETMFVLPPAALYLGYLAWTGSGTFAAVNWQMDGWLMSAGIVTAAPLILFVAGARRIPLSLLGLLQYIVPTAHFALAVTVFGEPLSRDQLMTFVLIWVALVVYTLPPVRRGPAAPPG